MNVAKQVRRLSGWTFAILGSAGVVLLLMMFAGVFTKKVSTVTDSSARQMAPGAQTATVRLVKRPRYESAVGSIEPIHQSSVASKIMAKVTEVNASAGQAVSVGDVLVRLDDEDLKSRLKQSEAAYEAAKASAEQARSNLKRAQQLVRGNAISQAEFEAAQTAVRTSEANLDQADRSVDEARVMLSYSTITAPMQGIIVDKQVQSGDTVSPGQTLLTVYDPSQMQLVANVRESFAMKLKIGQQVSAKLESMDYECSATVREVVPQAEAGSRSFQVKVTGPCPPGIYSGMFGRINLPLGEEEIMLIPSSAVQRVGQLRLVDVVDARDGGPSMLTRRSVQLGRSFGDDVEVLTGLRVGEQVVVGAARTKSLETLEISESGE